MIVKCVTGAIACCLGILCANASFAELTTITKYGSHEGPRFIHEITGEDCILTETQWEKQADGSRVLWEKTLIQLRGAALLDIAAIGLPEGSPARSSTMLDGTNRPKNPLASITVTAQLENPGTAEILSTRNIAKSMIRRNKATPSSRNGGKTHVIFTTTQVLIVFLGADVAPQMLNLEQAINKAIRGCNPTS